MNKILVTFVAFFSISIVTAQKKLCEEELIGKGAPKLYGEGINLRKDAYKAFLKMKEAAAKEGINITIVSSYRNFERQKAIWERKYEFYTSEGLSPEKSMEKIIEYSTIPGTSRHHWGTDIDIIDGNQKYTGDVLLADKFEPGGPFAKLKMWMDKNAKSFGFVLVYTNADGRKGFKYEPWHYTYAPLSIGYLKQYKALNIKEILNQEGLLGAEHFTDEFIQAYYKNNILDINPELL